MARRAPGPRGRGRRLVRASRVALADGIGGVVLRLPILLAAVAVPQVTRLAEELPRVEREPAPG